MKELILVRHAKSDWGNEFLNDTDRPLNERGYRDAYAMVQWYAESKKAPQAIVSSPATRAVSTALIFRRELGLPLSALLLEESIYEAGTGTLMKVVQKLPASFDRVMVFGHNPGFTDLANQLSSELFFDNIPTCGIVSFTFDVRKWSSAAPGKARPAYHQFPKDFRNVP